MKATRDEVAKLKETGLSNAEIGRRLDKSRERVRQIVTGKPKRVPQPKIMLKVMLTVDDVAQCLGLHPNTVRRWSDKGILKSYRIGLRRDRRFRREDIDDFLKDGGASPRSSRPWLYRHKSNRYSWLSETPSDPSFCSPQYFLSLFHGLGFK